MKITFLYFITLCLSIAFLPSCSKDDNNNTGNQSKSTLLQAKKWRLVSVTLNGTDVTSDFQDDCDKDDYSVFKSGGVLEVYPGTTKCDPTDPDIETLTWSISTDEKTLTVDGEDFTLISITSSSLQVSVNFGFGDLIQNFQGF